MDAPAAATWGPSARWWAYHIALAVAIGIGLVVLYWSATSMGFEDVEAYWSAGLRLREGQPLYPAALDTANSMYYGAAYRYAPWFAFAWVPLTYLPRDLVTVLWAAALFGAVAYVGWQLRGRWIAFALLLPFLFDSATDGNVQPLLVAALVYGVTRRSGPVWIALTASLKGAPLAFMLVYFGRREWRKAAETLVLTALLLAPMLAFDLSRYPTDPGGRVLFYGSIMYPIAVVLAEGATLLLARSRWAWLAAGATAILAMPRFWTYDLTWLIPGGRPKASLEPRLGPLDQASESTRRSARAIE